MVHGERPVVNDPLRTGPVMHRARLLRPSHKTTNWNRGVNGNARDGRQVAAKTEPPGLSAPAVRDCLVLRRPGG